ncbi:hypothetical protein UM93_06120 [Psychromicrobium lacuslunae]|uniref:DUF4440 domain-containing protein n=1 Tax=Psychromicrobium lacuslunae TaxID=1618207 RepID=A0A0D4C2Z6_9MICC|nr:hypothetical protein UM93_06120 [Psychromicrobium lacuslunae]
MSAVVERFLSAFVSGTEAAQRAELLREVLLPEAIIVRTCGQQPAIYSVEEFIAPRIELLSSGRFENFREWLVSSQIEVFGDIAQAWCRYSKSWTEAGEEHLEHGMKTVHLIRTGDEWRISAMAWDDERSGLKIPDFQPRDPAIA